MSIEIVKTRTDEWLVSEDTDTYTLKREAKIVFKDGVFGHCVPRNLKSPWSFDDWKFVGIVAAMIEIEVSKGTVNITG